MKLSQIEEARTDTTHEVFIPVRIKGEDGQLRDDRIRIVYRPLTPEHLALSTVAGIVAVVVEWNLEADDGSPLPVTYQALNTRPMPFLNSIMEAIMGDFFPGKKK